MKVIITCPGATHVAVFATSSSQRPSVPDSSGIGQSPRCSQASPYPSPVAAVVQFVADGYRVPSSDGWMLVIQCAPDAPSNANNLTVGSLNLTNVANGILPATFGCGYVFPPYNVTSPNIPKGTAPFASIVGYYPTGYTAPPTTYTPSAAVTAMQNRFSADVLPITAALSVILVAVALVGLAAMRFRRIAR